MFSHKSLVIFIILIPIISPIWAHVNLLNPKGGETFIPGQLVNIEWVEVLSHNSLNWDLLFSNDDCVTWDTITSNIPISTMNYTWELPNIATQTGRIKVVQDNVEEDYEDVSENFIISSVTDIDWEKEIIKAKIYPNPITEFSIIEFENPGNNSHSLTLYNSKGHIIRRIKEIKTNRIQLDLMDLSKGIYFFQLNSGTDLVSSESFIVQ